MKKLLITLGTIGAAIAPVAAVVACGSSDTNTVSKINGKTNTEIKALSVAEFNTFINDTYLKAQPEEATGKSKFAVSADKAIITYTDKQGNDNVLESSDASKNTFLAALGIYTSTPLGKGATAAQSQAGGTIKAWWKDVVGAFKAYLA